MEKRLLKIILSVLGLLLFYGGLTQAGYIDIYEDTIINNNLVADSIVRVHDSAHITVQATSYVTFGLLDSSIATVYGGNATYRAYNSSVLTLYGGDFATRSPSVGYDGNLAKIYIYGKNFVYQPAGYDGFLSGNWLDENETAFNIYLRGLPQPFEQVLGTNIFLVPEPVSMSLLLLGIVAIRKSRG
jgi:hypothetical protein